MCLARVIVESEAEWTGEGALGSRVAEWTKQRGTSPRLYPGALVWCIKKAGRDLREKLKVWLAWSGREFAMTKTCPGIPRVVSLGGAF